MTHDYHADQNFGDLGFIVRVTSTMEALGDQPWHVQIIPDDILLPVESFMIESGYGLIAAQEGLDRYKEKHGLNPTTSWAL